jgi:hypothetical protein
MIIYMETKNKPTRFIAVDTSALISFFSPNDSNHDKAVSILESLAQELVVMVTPTDAYSETLNTLNKKLGRAQTIEVAEYLSNGPLLISAKQPTNGQLPATGSPNGPLFALPTAPPELSSSPSGRVQQRTAKQNRFLLVDTADLAAPSLDKFKIAVGSPSYTDSVVMATADKR